MITYKHWRNQVDQIVFCLASAAFLARNHIDEWRYRAAFNDGQSAERAARSIVEVNSQNG